MVRQTDGTISKTVMLPEVKTGEGGDAGQLALSPDGKGIVVSFDNVTCFLTSSGKPLSVCEGDDAKGYLAQPTFSPDGKQVAFKVMKSLGENRSG